MAGEQAGIRLVFGLFQHWDRDYIRRLRCQYNVAELERSLGLTSGRRFAIRLLNLVLFFATTAAWMYACCQFALYYVARDPDHKLSFGLEAPLLAGASAGFIAGMVTTILADYAIMRLLFGNRMHEYMVLECLRYQFDSYRRTLQMVTIFAIPLLILAALCLDTYTFVTSNQMVMNLFWGFSETRYPFAQIKSLKESPFRGRTNGEVQPKRYHSVEFRDGTTWSSLGADQSMTPRDQWEGEAIVKYISQQTGLPIEHVDADK